jgi:xanthine/uracil permease
MKKLTFKMNTYAAMIVVGISMFAKGFAKIVPFIIAVAVGYGFSAAFGFSIEIRT